MTSTLARLAVSAILTFVTCWLPIVVLSLCSMGAWYFLTTLSFLQDRLPSVPGLQFVALWTSTIAGAVALAVLLTFALVSARYLARMALGSERCSSLCKEHELSKRVATLALEEGISRPAVLLYAAGDQQPRTWTFAGCWGGVLVISECLLEKPFEQLLERVLRHSLRDLRGAERNLHGLWLHVQFSVVAAVKSMDHLVNGAMKLGSANPLQVAFAAFLVSPIVVLSYSTALSARLTQSLHSQAESFLVQRRERRRAVDGGCVEPPRDPSLHSQAPESQTTVSAPSPQ